MLTAELLSHLCLYQALPELLLEIIDAGFLMVFFIFRPSLQIAVTGEDARLHLRQGTTIEVCLASYELKAAH